MSKKIIIVGPPGAGKTTLRKIFFEGENAAQLLEYALEPTHGQESLILNLKEDVGIFDLAGQENQRWFETDENKIFYNTKVILVIIDITTPIETILVFIRKILEIRSLITPNSLIYVLLHKIDLMSQKNLNEIKRQVADALFNEKFIKVLFSSVKKEYFSDTLSFFIEIVKICLQDEISSDNFDFLLLNETIMLLQLIDQELIISKKDLHERSSITKEKLNRIIDHLVQKGQIQLSPVRDENVLSLTEKGKINFNKILKNFSLNTILSFKSNANVSDISKPAKFPPFLGYFIANKDGIVLLKVELYKGALLSYLKNKFTNKNNIKEDKYDVDLIPMFISALEKFSQEINIQNLSGFSLMGTNLKMQIFGFDQYTVTVFSNPNVNVKNIEYTIENYFKNFFETHDYEFQEAVKTGSLSEISYLEEMGAKWLEELNKSYEHTIINLELFDTESTKDLYDKLNELQDEVNREFSLTLEKIKKLKTELMKALVHEDFEEVKMLAKIFQKLKMNFAFNRS